MTFWTLIRRSLRFHARAHLGVVLGAAIGSTTLIGALVVGDSVKGSLTARALRRLGPTHFSLNTGDRFFLADLSQRLGNDIITQNLNSPNAVVHYSLVNSSPISTALLLPGTATSQDDSARANRVTILGVDSETWPHFAHWNTADNHARRESRSGRAPTLPSTVLEQWRAGELVFINEALARQLNCHEGDEIILRVRKPSALAQDAVISPHDQSSVALRFKVGALLSPDMLAEFNLSVSQITPANVFLPLDVLAQRVELDARANLLLHGPVLDPHSVDKLQEQQKRVAASAQSGSPAGPALELKSYSWAAAAVAIDSLNRTLKGVFNLEDAQLSLRTNDQPASLTGGESIKPTIGLTSSRIFLEPSIIQAAITPCSQLLTNHDAVSNNNSNDIATCGFVTNGIRILTYLANLVQCGDRATPYSMVTAADAPFTPPDMRADEILVNPWLAEDLNLKPGDKLDLVYYAVDSASHLIQRTNSFRLRGIIPLKGIYADRTLMPDFPGVAKAESTHQWDTGFPLVYTIRDKDEAYWKQYRGTPKAFIRLAAGQALWASRFGSLTAIRYEVPNNSLVDSYRDAVYRNLLANLDPATLGFHFEPVREQALKAATEAQDFGELFLGFSLFLVIAALLLMALLFQFSLEQRTTEVGTFLALGFAPQQVRRLLLVEGAALAFAGGILGVLGGIAYAKAMLLGLATIWNSAVAGTQLGFYVTPVTLLIGLLSSTVVATLTIWLSLRRQARQPARELLVGELHSSAVRHHSRALWIALVSGLLALGIVGWMIITKDTANAGAFFGAGSLFLISGLALVAAWLARLERVANTPQLTLASLGVRGCARRRKRSVATVALLSSGCFLIAAIAVFRLDANLDATQRTSGTGGFALIGESSLSVVQDLNTSAGRQFFGLSDHDFAGAQVIPFRVHDGDEASCLNLNRAQKPRLLGVKPDQLTGRFTFAAVAKDLDATKGWSLLTRPAASKNLRPDEIPAIGDANSIEWALGKKIGDTIDYTDSSGQSLKLRLVGAVANSILQGSLLIDEAAFVEHFPGESGYRMFLLDTPSNSVNQFSKTLTRALQDVGLELTPTVQRLNAFNAVQNTYLGTFQILGGLGLLLGSAGLGVVVLRNVLERRGELGLLLAVGFRRKQLLWLILSEHGALLGLGLGLGLLAAAVAVLPALLSPATRLPYSFLGITLAAILLNGGLWTWLATHAALRGDLLKTLRNE
ncbi:MAG TPA: FtsX-like permease family protein [Candidatus Limnocylindrales bacterium]|nr:FtsX-like permease family protein [Candidatus Limnocylindrales bacterium]